MSTDKKNQKTKEEQKQAAKTRKYIDNAEKKAASLKPFTLWAVFDNTIDSDTPITFTTTREEAIIALDQYLYLKNYIHFRMWCNLRDLPINHGSSWSRYSQDILIDELSTDPATNEAPYLITRLDYKPNIIASLLRSINNCIPLGCSFDTEEEIEEFSEYLSAKTQSVEAGEDTYTPLEEAMVALFDDLDAKPEEPEELEEEEESARKARGTYDA